MTTNQQESDKTTAVSIKAPLTEGSLWKAIWIMSWPLVLTTVAGSVTSMVDIQVAGWLGSASQAAVGLSEQILFVFMVFIMSISVGTTAVVSRSFGAGDLNESVSGTAQSLVLAVLSGVVLSICSLSVAYLLLPLFAGPPALSGQAGTSEVVEQGRGYLALFSIFLIPFSLTTTINAAFRAIGDARTPLLVVLVSTAICIAGDYLTVRANWPVAGLGISGIAGAAIVGNTAAAALALWRLCNSPLKASLQQLFPIAWELTGRIIKIGIPSAMQRLSYTAAVFMMFFILSHCPAPVQAIASWTIGIRIESILFMPLMALSMAVSSIVGQNLGARQPKRAIQAGWHVTWVGVALMIVLGCAVYFEARPLACLMSHDPLAVEFTASYLRINALAEPLLAVAMILSGALQGAGETKSPMWISIFCNWLVRLPLLWLFALSLKQGPTGAWTAMATSIVVMGILVAWRFQSGSWVKARN